MKRGKKIAVGLLLCFLSIFILLFAAILIVPRFINRGALWDKVRSEVSRLVGGKSLELEAQPGVAGSHDPVGGKLVFGTQVTGQAHARAFVGRF